MQGMFLVLCKYNIISLTLFIFCVKNENRNIYDLLSFTKKTNDMNTSDNNKADLKATADASGLNKSDQKQKEIQGSDADTDQSIGKFNGGTTADPATDNRGSDADADKNGNSSI